MSLQQLAALNDAASMVRKAAVAAQGRPDLSAHVAQLTSALFQLEEATQRDMSARAKRPLPAVDTNKVGGWATMIREGSSVAIAMQLPTNEMLLRSAAQLSEAAAQVIAAAEAPRQAPPPQAFSGAPAPVAQPRPVVAAPSAPSLPGRGTAIAMQFAAALATGGLAYWTHRQEKQARADGLELDPNATPAAIRMRSQRLLDEELPGARVTLSPGVDGEWIGSVKKGAETIARITGRRPQQAAAGAVKRALEYEDLRKNPADVEFVGTEAGASAVDVTPKAKKKSAVEPRVEAP